MAALLKKDISATAVFPVGSRWDADTASDFEQQTQDLLMNGGMDIVLDCRDLVFLTGAGLRSMLAMAKVAREENRTLRVTGLRGQAKALFEACRYDAFIPQADL